jgi:thymidylate kinase
MDAYQGHQFEQRAPHKPAPLGIGRYVFIDGPSGVGKSSLGAGLQRRISGGLVLPEYTDMVGEVASLKELCMPPSDAPVEVHTRAALMWSKVDLARRYMLYANQYQNDCEVLSVVDTSPLMVIGFELIKERQGHPTPLTSILKGYVTLVNEKEGDILMPDHWIFLYAKPETVQRRMLERGIERIHPLLFQESSISFFCSFYESFRQHYLNPEEYSVVDTEVASKIDVVNESLSCLPKSRKGSVGLMRFILDLYDARASGIVSLKLEKMRSAIANGKA